MKKYLLLIGAQFLLSACYYVEVCKVAGEGTQVGTEFDFEITSGGLVQTLSIPAGPAPGGTCMRTEQTVRNGTDSRVVEVGANDYWVNDISQQSNTDIDNLSLPLKAVDLVGGGRVHSGWTGIRSVKYENQRRSIIKVCKAVDESIPIGTPFQFQANLGSALVSAGPMPDGYCQILKGDYVSGMDIEIIELSGSQYEVTDIVIDPKPDDLATSTEEKKIKFNIPPGVTEVTFTNKIKDTGFLEICKTGNADGDFEFMIDQSNGRPVGPLTVSNNSCSPALEVKAGITKITEKNNADAALTECKTFPSTHQLGCDVKKQTSTVQVLPGDKSKQTIAYIDNEKQ